MGIDLHYFVECKENSDSWYEVLISPPKDFTNCSHCFYGFDRGDEKRFWLLQGLWPRRGWPTDVSAPIEEYRTEWINHGTSLIRKTSTYVTLPELLEYVECKLFGKAAAAQTWVTDEKFYSPWLKPDRILKSMGDRLRFLSLVDRLAKYEEPEKVRVLMFWE